jgi:hypothetical protein
MSYSMSYSSCMPSRNSCYRLLVSLPRKFAQETNALCRESSWAVSPVCLVGMRVGQTCPIWPSKRSACVFLLCCWLLCCSEADPTALALGNLTLISHVVIHSPCCCSDFLVTTMMVSPKLSSWNRFTPRRFRIAACASVRYLCSKSRVAV